MGVTLLSCGLIIAIFGGLLAKAYADNASLKEQLKAVTTLAGQLKVKLDIAEKVMQENEKIDSKPPSDSVIDAIGSMPKRPTSGNKDK